MEFLATPGVRGLMAPRFIFRLSHTWPVFSCVSVRKASFLIHVTSASHRAICKDLSFLAHILSFQLDMGLGSPSQPSPPGRQKNEWVPIEGDREGM